MMTSSVRLSSTEQIIGETQSKWENNLDYYINNNTNFYANKFYGEKWEGQGIVRLISSNPFH